MHNLIQILLSNLVKSSKIYAMVMILIATNGFQTVSTAPLQTTVFASNSSELISALKNANNSTTVLLAPGDYGYLDLNYVRQPYAKFLETVTIQSADTDDPASFSGVTLKGVENLTFDRVKFDYTSPVGADHWSKTVTVDESQDITITNSIFDGDLAHGVSDIADGYGTGYGLSVSNSENITIDKNEFFNWYRAGVFGGTESLKVSNNDVHSIRSDGFDFIDVDTVLIEGNYIHNFAAAEGSGDHGDMIQFWTTGTTSPSTNIIIRENIFDSGSGDGSQTIFMRNEMVDRGLAGNEMYYQNVIIEDNIIYNAHAHGITVGETDGLMIQNNTILHNADTASGNSVYIPKINVADTSTNVSIINNIVPSLQFGANENRIVENNLIVQQDYPDQANYYGDLFVDALAGSDATIADLKALPGGLIEKMGVGANLTQFDKQPNIPNGFIVDKAGTGLNLLTHIFDATNIYGPDGLINLTDAQVIWQFGDGKTGTGDNVTHTYEKSGEYVVSANITLSDGQKITTDKTVLIETPVIIDANFDSSALDLSDYSNPVKVGEGVTFEPSDSGNSAKLNGSTITYDKSPDFYNNSEYTLRFDFKKEEGAENSSGRAINFSGSFVLSIEADGVKAAVSTDVGGGWLGAQKLNINDSDWHQIALTFSGDKGTAILYVDGAEVARMEGLDGGIQTGNASQAFHVGNPWGDGFPGHIDNLVFLSGAMTADQIKNSYQSPSQNIIEELGLVSIDRRAEPEEILDNPIDTIDESSNYNLIEAELTEVNGYVIGTHDNDKIVGNENRDVIKGLGGDDLIIANGGNDHINAGDGDDRMHGGDGDDYMHGFAGFDTAFGGQGNDTIYANLAYGESGDDNIRGENGVSDSLYGGQGNDALVGYGGHDLLFGEADNDILTGGDGDDLLDGGSGDDMLWGDRGNDTLLGGLGNDGLGGGDGSDFLDGGGGIDNLGGGSGDDIFVFDAADSIHGHSGIDTLLIADNDASNIDLAALDVYSIEKIDMENGAGNVLSLGYEDILKSETDSMLIKGDAEDTVEIAELMIYQGEVMIDEESFQHYKYSMWSHEAELFIESELEVQLPKLDLIGEF